MMYAKQIESKKCRGWSKRFGFMFNDEVYSKIYSKHFKSHYNGKPTKKYLKLMNQIEKREQINIEDFERSLLM